MAMCPKTISSGVRKILSIAKAHMSPGSLLSSAVSATLVTGIFLVSMQQAGELTRVPLQLGITGWLIWLCQDTAYKIASFCLCVCQP